jgi:hypothetical protein
LWIEAFDDRFEKNHCSIIDERRSKRIKGMRKRNKRIKRKRSINKRQKAPLLMNLMLSCTVGVLRHESILLLPLLFLLLLLPLFLTSSFLY